MSSLIDNSGYRILTLNAEDIPQTVGLHRQVFPDYFLTHMGQDFLERFYTLFLSKPGYGFVAKSQGEIIGFVTGTTELGGFYNRFYRDNFAAIVFTVAARFVTDPFIRRNIAARMGHIRSALNAMIGRSRSGPTESSLPDERSERSAHLLSIGVSPLFRGKGVAEALTKRFCDELAQDGVGSVYLSVFADNRSAIRFYEKDGWRQLSAEGDSLLFCRSLVALPTRQVDSPSTLAMP